MKQTLILSNIITMDEKRPFAKALQWAGIDAAYAKRIGYDMVHVDENGEPDGYICENPVMEIMPKLPVTMEYAKNYLMAWQDFALSSGFTGVADAGVEIFFKDSAQANIIATIVDGEEVFKA